MTEDQTSHSTRRAATTGAILDAAERLFSARGFDGVSVRDIGQAAGVSHALIHRYLGSKSDVYRSVVARNDRAVRDAAGETEDLALAASRMLREGLEHRRDHIRLITETALHSHTFEEAMGSTPAVERLVELAEARATAASGRESGQLPPRLVIAAIVALFLGWGATESWLLAATGLEDLDEETVVQGVEQIIQGIIAQQLPSGEV